MAQLKLKGKSCHDEERSGLHAEHNHKSQVGQI